MLMNLDHTGIEVFAALVEYKAVPQQLSFLFADTGLLSKVFPL
jgi:hypothetical protein